MAGAIPPSNFSSQSPFSSPTKPILPTGPFHCSTAHYFIHQGAKIPHNSSLLHSDKHSKMLKDICKIWMEDSHSKQDLMLRGKDEGCTFITQPPRLRPGPQGTQRAAGETEELRDGVHVQGAEMTSRSTNKSDLIWVGLPVCTNRAFFCRKCQPQNTHCSR